MKAVKMASALGLSAKQTDMQPELDFSSRFAKKKLIEL